MKYGSFTVGIPDWPPREAVRRLAKLGYDGVEWRVTHQASAETPGFWAGNRCTLNPDEVPAQAEEIRRMVEAAGLDMFALGTYSRADDLSVAERDMIAAAALGVGQLRIGPPPYDRSKGYAGQFAAGRRQYAKVARLAAKYNVRANVETHMGTFVMGASSAIRFVDGLDPGNVGVIWDPGNTAYEGFEPPKVAVEILGDYLAYVHVKNARGAFEHVTPAGTAVWEMGWAPLQAGMINWEEVLAALVAAGYDGWLSFEDFGPGQTEAKLRDDIRYLRACEKTARKLAHAHRG